MANLHDNLKTNMAAIANKAYSYVLVCVNNKLLAKVSFDTINVGSDTISFVTAARILVFGLMPI